MFESFNNTKLFEDSGPQNCQIGNELVAFLTVLNEIEDSKFWNSFLRSFFTYSWAPVPLFYLARAFSFSSSSCTLDQETLQRLKDFVTFQLKCQEPMIRGAAQTYLLQTVLDWTLEVKKDKEMSAIDFLWSFHGEQNVLIRSTPLWSKCCIWIKNLFGSNLDVDKLAQELVDRSGERQSQLGHKIGFFYVLLHDAYHEIDQDISR